ncbi:MAG: hypothetical protein L6Q95_04435 [Planctomycetes bacterium]|nr:hypothetical protein [Planctomycetota bacterium]
MLIDATGEVGKLYDAKTTPNVCVIDAKGVRVDDTAIDDKKYASHRSAAPTRTAALSSTPALGSGHASDSVARARARPPGASPASSARATARGQR